MAGGVAAGARNAARVEDDATRVPAVVAVLATRDPGPWFDETLAALAAQDYAELSVLVMVTGAADPTERVARALPSAFVRRLREGRSYGAAVDEALSMVQGTAFFLLCHDDCAPDPDAVRLMVQESYRSNAGIVTPKMVRWDDPSVLLHVGLHADRTGAVVERVQVGEVDHGQHDAVMDVFVAPGGFTLVRADLLRELGGYDRTIVAMGEDLDLCWRAHVAGARVVVAPDARVRHLEALAGGARPLPPAAAASSPTATLQALQRRHELRVLLTCTSRLRLALVLLLAFALAAGEVAVALVVGDRQRARAVVDAWRWNLARAPEIRRRRAAVQRRRARSDRQVRGLQLRGSARLTTYVSRLAHQGFEVAHGVRPATAERAAQTEGDPLATVPVLTGSVGASFSEDDDFDELDDLGRRGGRDRFGRRVPRRMLGSRRSRLAVWAVAVVLLIVGSRGILGGGLPLTGQFLPFLSWTSTWHHLVTEWQPAGVGTTAPASPGFAVLGMLGTLLLGHMGQLQKVMILGALPLGAWGLSRFLRPFTSPRARFAGALSYLGLALPYDALARGRWDCLVAYAAAPWLVARLARATGRAPFAPTAGGWRATLAGQVLVLGVVETVAVALAPVVAVVVLLAAVGLALGSAAVGDWRGGVRAVGAAAGATAVTAVLCLPWLVGTLAAGTGALSVLGLVSPTAGAPGWSDLLRFAVGPVGGSALSWLLLGAATLPLLVARQERLAWAGRLWAMAGCSWLLALASLRGWTGPFAPSVDAVLAPAAVAVAACVGIGVTAFENDLAGYAFGWRQLASLAAVAAVGVGLLPVVAEAADGRWGMATTGYAQPLASLASAATTDGYRVLWIGAPQVLPTGAWSVDGDLAYATTGGGLPNATDLWLPATPGPAAALGRDVALAADGRTVRLGRLLASAAVRYIVVVEDLAPAVTGSPPTLAVAPPTGLVRALSSQEDLRQSQTSAQGYQIFENTDFVPERAERSSGAAPTRAVQPTAADVSGWRLVLPRTAEGDQTYAGHVDRGTVLSSMAPAGSWQLTVNGHAATRRPAFGWASQFAGVPAGTATLVLHGSLRNLLAELAELAVWLLVAAVLIGRRRLVDWWWRPWRARRAAKRELRLQRAHHAERVRARASPQAGPHDGHEVVVAPDEPAGVVLRAGGRRAGGRVGDEGAANGNANANANANGNGNGNGHHGAPNGNGLRNGNRRVPARSATNGARRRAAHGMRSGGAAHRSVGPDDGPPGGAA